MITGLTKQRSRVPLIASRRASAIQLGKYALLVLAILIVAVSPSEHRIAVALAILNIGLVLVVAFGASRLGFGNMMAVIAFLPMVAVSWPLTTLYFALFHTEARYVTLDTWIRCLDGAERVQIVLLVFLAGYGAAIALAAFGLRPHQRRPLAPAVVETEVERGLILLGVASVTVGWVSAVLGATGDTHLIANALRNFYTGCILIAGYRWHSLGPTMRTLVLVGLGLAAIVNTVANSRGLAMWPLVMLLLGYLASPKASRRHRIIVVAVGVLALPAYAVVGNQTRIALRSIGFEDLNVRANALANSLSDLQFEQEGFISDAMLRAFSSGGHALITNSWTRADIEELDVGRFASELADSIKPAFAGGTRPSRYTGNSILKDYGFLITDKTSVETSMPGSLFEAGGILFVFIGGAILALAQRLFFGGTGNRENVGSLTLARVGGLVGITLGAFTADLINVMRMYFWTTIYVSIAWAIFHGAVALRAPSRPQA